MSHDPNQERLIERLQAMKRATRRARLMPGLDHRDDEAPVHGWWVRDDDDDA